MWEGVPGRGNRKCEVDKSVGQVKGAVVIAGEE